ncbi:prolyl oligopeptidase family serine peptidase [Thalassoglobus polymorphus]|uniref:Prolyl oligopeptidase family protein n=1 Tax=Thalassoglobus polymorphus TaxID=2527994 RepID=A0A517QLV4_9PLAN|nr:prolyl oligopeptidase family serine peptidase [Thalassoglobus polymorphus]QDT32614.1 Prolyl oligopeptidase family protein [Thalassoglobus polymorphus]
MSKFAHLLILLCVISSQSALADGPQDNSVKNVRPIPQVGIEIPEETKTELQEKLDHLAAKINELKTPKHKEIQHLIPDVEVFHRAVTQALLHREMFHERDIKTCVTLLKTGTERAEALKLGKAPWTRQHGLVVRGFISDLDGTVQPYGLEIADDYDFDNPRPVRCDIWFHGRGERTMEIHFLSQRSRGKGPYPPTSGIVLHPYGRYSNAFKFAGEVDTLEALDHVEKNYQIDQDRISVRGFSMGGAACWQFAVHYPDRWFAANPGAGFSETPLFLKSFQGETLNPPWYEEKLWRMYDCDKWADNLLQLPTVAYSGDMDSQKQAADVMEEVLKRHGIDLMHVIGPNTAHKIHPESNQIIRAKFDSLAERGRERFPNSVHLTTFTLKYNRSNWITIHSLKEHWERSTIRANITSKNRLEVATDGITEFSINFPAGHSPFALLEVVKVDIDGQEVSTVKTKSDLSLNEHFHRRGDQWFAGPSESQVPLKKAHNLQGPVDDAMMSAFLFVSPTGNDELPNLNEWVDAEMSRAVKEWRRHMRGDVRIKKDSEVTEEDIANYNLILWGTPKTNSLIWKVAKDLPIHWGDNTINVGDKKYSNEQHVPILIYPNPLNPKKYVVLNSSFTYREYDYLNNARQTPKLPDWSIIDITTPPNFRWPGKIINAGFFNENWELKTNN